MLQLKSITPQSTGQVPPPSLAIPAMLDQVYENLTQVEQNCEILRERLQPVLERDYPCEGDRVLESQSKARNVPHAEHLEGVAARISTVNSIVLDLLNRVHV